MDEHSIKKLVRSKSGLRIVSTNEDVKSPFLLCEPRWTPDREISNCTECKSKFNFTLRKHHCRRCGFIYCKRCSETKLLLPRMSFIDPVRLCDHCAKQTSHEQDFFEKHLKVLTNGASFLIDSSVPEPEYLQCKLSHDHRYLVFEGISHEPIDVLMIKYFTVSNESDANAFIEDDTTAGSVMELTFTADPGEPDEHIKFITGPDPLRKQSNSWILALKQALQLVHNLGPFKSIQSDVD